jgi:hypothetical protein
MNKDSIYYADTDSMIDLIALEQEQRAAYDLHHGYLCTVEL